MTDLAIETTHLRKVFGEKVAVEDLSLQVKRGEVFGFLGPNGAGKTTSIKMLLSLVKPTSGNGKLLGQSLGDVKTRAKVGYLPEHFRFHDWLTGTEFLDLNGQLYGMSRTERRKVIPDLLELVGLGKRGDTKLRAYSKGMTQRIGLAQALINNPELVFLDEPTSGLDPIGRRLVRDIIDGLRAEGTAVFLNSHLLSEVEKTCDRVAFINHGKILEVSHMREFRDAAVQVTLRVGQPTPDLINQLANFGQGVTLHSANGTIQLSVPTEETLPTLANWLIQSGHTLYELSPRQISLEDRFLEIIGNVSGDSA